MNNAIIAIWTGPSGALKAYKKLFQCTCKVKEDLRCQRKKTKLPSTELCKYGCWCGKLANRFESKHSDMFLIISVPKQQPKSLKCKCE